MERGGFCQTQYARADACTANSLVQAHIIKRQVFRLACYIINLKGEQSWLPSHEILNAVLQRKMLSNVALKLSIHEGRFIH